MMMLPNGVVMRNSFLLRRCRALPHRAAHHHHQQQQQRRMMMVSSQTSIYSAPFLAVQTNIVPLMNGSSGSGSGGGGSSSSGNNNSSNKNNTGPTSSSSSSSLMEQQKKSPPASGWKKTIVSSAASTVVDSDDHDRENNNNNHHQLNGNSAVPSSSEQEQVDKFSVARKKGLIKQEQQQDEDESTSSSSSSSKPQKQNLKLEVDMEELQHLASLRCTPLSLRDMYKYAVDLSDNGQQRLRNAQFLHRELPIRIAQRAVDLLTLPHGFGETLPIQQVAHVYLLYLEKFQNLPKPTTPELETQFTDMLQSMVLDRTSIPVAVAQGVDIWTQQQQQQQQELQLDDSDDTTDEGQHVAAEEETVQEIEDALYRFFTARVGLRFLTEHHILSSPNHKSSSSTLRKSQSKFHDDVDDESSPEKSSSSTTTTNTNNNNEEKGCIQTDCCPKDEIIKVVKAVTKQTEEQFGLCPEIQIISSKNNKSTKFTYVPHHLHYMVGELVKNSCRSTVNKYLERKAKGENTVLPPIRIVIVKGKEDVTIKVADRGGGIPRSKMPTVFRFAHSTASEDENSTDFGVDEMTGTKIRGFGLPLARIYARYLGGELTLKSMEGYGLDAYLYLPRLGDACENLPLPVKFSPGELNSNPPRKAVQ